MAIALFSWVNHVAASATVLSASNSVGDLGPDNMGSPIIGRRWRTDSLTAQGQIDFGSDKTVEVLALRFPRDTTFPTTGTIRHRLDADGGTPGSGVAYDSTAVSLGTVDGYGYHFHKPSSSITARYWYFDFSVSGVSFIDVGLAWAGEALQPTRSIDFGHGDAWGDLSTVEINQRSGAEFVDGRPKRRELAFGIRLDDADRQELREMQRIAGVSGQVLFTVDPADANLGKEVIIGRLAESSPILHPNVDLYSKAFVIRESL